MGSLTDKTWEASNGAACGSEQHAGRKVLLADLTIQSRLPLDSPAVSTITGLTGPTAVQPVSPQNR